MIANPSCIVANTFFHPPVLLILRSFKTIPDRKVKINE